MIPTYCDVKSRPFLYVLQVEKNVLVSVRPGYCALLLHSSNLIPEEINVFSASKLSLEWVCRTASKASQRWCPKALHVSSVLGCSRHSWFSSQLSLSRIWPQRQHTERALAKHTHKHTRVIMKCYGGCKNTSTLQRGRYQLRTVSKNVIGVIQKAVPDGVATAALTHGRLIWVAVWTPAWPRSVQPNLVCQEAT